MKYMVIVMAARAEKKGFKPRTKMLAATGVRPYWLILQSK